MPFYRHYKVFFFIQLSNSRFNAATDEFKPNKGKKVDENYVESINNTVTNKIRFSDQILKTDYYRVVFGDSQ